MAPLCKGFAYPVSILMSAILLQMEISTAVTTVPVILWNQAFITTSNSPFHETSKEQFQTQLNEVLGKGKPPILLFVKDDLCYEDMQLSREILGRLSNTLPSMQWAAQSSVLPILESLSSYNVTMDDEIECIEENQLLKVPISDLKSIDAKFIRFRKSNLITVLTGMFCRYSTLERAKRAIALDVAESLIVSHDGKILLYADQRPVLKVNNKEYTLQLPPKNVSLEMTDKIRNLSITFGTGDGEDYTFVAQFKVRGNGDELIGFYYQDKKTATWLLLKSQNDILLPDGSSYHCLRETFIARGSEDANRIISLTLSNLQLQMDTDSFGKVIDCTGFMSIPIWTGIFVTIILAVIVIWGLTMIVDIRTMDHFDDPKSKTIAISAQE